MTKPRIGPVMKSIADYVSAVPGCNCAEALRGVGLPHRGWGAYKPINRAIEAGLVIETGGHPCHLFASEADRELFDLRAELLGHPSPERAEEILAEITRLRERQADEYRTASQQNGQ